MPRYRVSFGPYTEICGTPERAALQVAMWLRDNLSEAIAVVEDTSTGNVTEVDLTHMNTYEDED